MTDIERNTEGLQSEWYKLVTRNAGDLPQALRATELWCNEAAGRKWCRLYRPANINTSLRIVCEKYARCWFVRCRETELGALESRLDETGTDYNTVHIQKTQLLRTYPNDEVEAALWLLAKDRKVAQAQKLPASAKPAVAYLTDHNGLAGYLRRMQKTSTYDTFYLKLPDEQVVGIEIEKGEAQTTKEMEEEKQKILHLKSFADKRWFVMKQLHTREMQTEWQLHEWVRRQNEEELREWQEAEDERLSSGGREPADRPVPMMLETFLPTDNIDLSVEEEERIARLYEPGTIAWRKHTKRLVFTGYLFIKANSKFLVKLAEGLNEPAIGTRLFAHIQKHCGLPQMIPAKLMENFMAAIEEETLQLTFGEDELMENAYAVFRGTPERMHLRGRVGRIVKKKGKLYLTFSPLPGLMTACKGFAVTEKEIRKPTRKELREIEE